VEQMQRMVLVTNIPDDLATVFGAQAARQLSMEALMEELGVKSLERVDLEGKLSATQRVQLNEELARIDQEYVEALTRMAQTAQQRAELEQMFMTRAGLDTMGGRVM